MFTSPSTWFETWGGILGWYFSSLCAGACENPRFTNHSHHSALFPVMFLLVRSHFQECPPCAGFSQTANEAQSLPGGLQSLWISSLWMQILNASLEQPHLETVLQGGTWSDVYGKEENKNLPLTSVSVGCGADLKFSLQHVFLFVFGIAFSSSLSFQNPCCQVGTWFCFPDWADSIRNGNFSQSTNISGGCWLSCVTCWLSFDYIIYFRVVWLVFFSSGFVSKSTSPKL